MTEPDDPSDAASGRPRPDGSDGSSSDSGRGDMDSAYSRVRLACVIGTTSILLGLFAVPWATNRDRTDSGAHVYLGNGRLVDLRWGLLDNWDAPGLIADLWLIVYASTVVWLAAGLVPALTCWTVFGTRRRGWRVRILVAVFALLLLSLVFYGLFLQPWENANKFFLGHLREAVVYFRPRPYGDVWLETYVSTVVWLTVGLALGMVGWAVLGVRRIGRRLRYGMAIAGLLAGVLSPHLLGPSIALAVLVLISPSWLTLIVAAVVTIQQAYAVGWIYFGHRWGGGAGRPLARRPRQRAAGLRRVGGRQPAVPNAQTYQRADTFDDLTAYPARAGQAWVRARPRWRRRPGRRRS